MEPKEYAIGAYKLILVRLTPYPKQDVSIKKKDYVAVFVVRKAS